MRYLFKKPDTDNSSVKHRQMKKKTDGFQRYVRCPLAPMVVHPTNLHFKFWFWCAFRLQGVKHFLEGAITIYLFIYPNFD